MKQSVTSPISGLRFPNLGLVNSNPRTTPPAGGSAFQNRPNAARFRWLFSNHPLTDAVRARSCDAGHQRVVEVVLHSRGGIKSRSVVHREDSTARAGTAGAWKNDSVDSAKNSNKTVLHQEVPVGHYRKQRPLSPSVLHLLAPAPVGGLEAVGDAGAALATGREALLVPPEKHDELAEALRDRTASPTSRPCRNSLTGEPIHPGFSENQTKTPIWRP